MQEAFGNWSIFNKLDSDQTFTATFKETDEFKFILAAEDLGETFQALTLNKIKIMFGQKVVT